MEFFDIWESDYRFMLLIWKHAPLHSREAVMLCEKELGWKKSTTYNAIRRMCEKGLIENINAMISVIVPKERVQASASSLFMERTFDSSLTQFITAFLSGKSISDREADEIKHLIDNHREGRK